ncbi:MAG: alpha-amylase family glycosyl hydrolase [Rickettsiales bacterium]
MAENESARPANLTAKLGDPHKLGATLIKDGEKGVNFAVYTGPDATDAWVCLFDDKGHETRYKLHGKKDFGYFPDNASICNGIVWHGFIPDIKAGQRYGFRVNGPFGLVHPNPHDLGTANAYQRNRLLTDPYALASESKDFDLKQGTGFFNYDPQDYSIQDIEQRYQRTKARHCSNIMDTAPYVPKSIVVDLDLAKWNAEERVKRKIEEGAIETLDGQKPSSGFESGKPIHRFSDANVSEIHVDEATCNFKEIPEAYRGTFKGLCHPAFIKELKKMGKTVVELMPVQRADDTHWKYNTFSFFDIDHRYAAKKDEKGNDLHETPLEQFTEMVQTLRKNGIEVWLDVVYNHTAEGDHLGPTTSLKGLDWRYYRHHGPQFMPEHFWDVTGTGNTLNTDHPRVRELILNNLAFFNSLGVSGFRFDLMKALGRAGASGEYRIDHPLFREILDATGRTSSIDSGNGHKTVKMDRVFLSGEHWDVGPGEAVPLPAGIAEWRQYARDTMHEVWRTLNGKPARIVATVIAGVGFMKPGMTHDDFTAWDAVSYANKQNPYDGSHHPSLNSGGKNGEDDNEKVMEERIRRVKFGLALEGLAHGAVLRKLGGWHSQQGDNNPYSADRKHLTRIPWGNDLKPYQKEIQEFEGICGRFKNAHPCLRRGEANPVTGTLYNPEYAVLHKHGDKDITWLQQDTGREMQGDWPDHHAFGILMSGETHRRNDNGEEVRDIPILALINGASTPQEMTIPHSEIGTTWKVVFDSSPTSLKGVKPVVQPGQVLGEGKITLPPFTTVVFESNHPLHRQEVKLDWLGKSQRSFDNGKHAQK